MAASQQGDWLTIGMETWSLMAEATTVVMLRSAALAMGGGSACREAQLMVTEKAEASAALGMALATGKLGSSAESVTRGTVAHYRKRVLANRKRLSRG
jgi:hypothetical protein